MLHCQSWWRRLSRYLIIEAGQKKQRKWSLRSLRRTLDPGDRAKINAMGGPAYGGTNVLIAKRKDTGNKTAQKKKEHKQGML